MADAEKLLILLEVQSRKMQSQLVQVNRQIDRFSAQAEKRFAGMQKSAEARFAGIGRAAVAGLSFAAAQRLLDANTRIQNALKNTGLAGEELAAVYDSLFVSAQRNAAPLEALAQLYSRVGLAQSELGISAEELLGFTDNVAVALRVAGKSATESSGALLQLSQALGSGIVRAEEFNSILEGALPIAQAAAAGLEEAGGSVAKLRALVVDGKVSSEAFFRAFEAGSSTLTDKVATAELTVSQGFIRLQNVMVDAAGKFDDATGASGALGAGLDGLASFVDKVGEAFRNNKGAIQDFFAEVRTQAAQTDAFLKGKRQPSGETTFFEPIDIDGIDRFVKDLFRGSGNVPTSDGDLAIPRFQPGDLAIPAGPGAITAANPRPKAAPATDPNLRTFREADAASLALLNKPKTVSLSDYKLPTGTGGGGKTPEEKATEALLAQQRKNESLIAETELRRALNPLLDDYGFAVEKLRTQQDLENAVVSAGLALTPDRKQAISDLADGYAKATVEAAKLAEAQEAARESMADWFETGRSAARGFIDDLVAGKSAAEALGGVFDKLSEKFLDIGLTAPVGRTFSMEFCP